MPSFPWALVQLDQSTPSTPRASFLALKKPSTTFPKVATTLVLGLPWIYYLVHIQIYPSTPTSWLRKLVKP